MRLCSLLMLLLFMLSLLAKSVIKTKSVYQDHGPMTIDVARPTRLVACCDGEFRQRLLKRTSEVQSSIQGSDLRSKQLTANIGTLLCGWDLCCCYPHHFDDYALPDLDTQHCALDSNRAIDQNRKRIPNSLDIVLVDGRQH
mmetsp:Transcript_24997/g.44309  ORF Transcript_24997/g.44309 Transcript_24997/m.44309 type:complete len:141 (+) Transcript_24997:1128-1550(+)